MDIFQCEMLIDHLIAEEFLVEEDIFSSDQLQNRHEVSIDVCSEYGSGMLEQALANQHVYIDDRAQSRVLIVDDYLQITPERLISDCTYLPVKAVGKQILVGPLTGGERGVCPVCLQYWIRQNRPVEAALQREISDDQILPPLQAEAPEIAWGLAGDWLARFFAADTSLEVDKIIEFDLSNYQVRQHSVTRRPQCSVCGDPQFMIRQAQQCPMLSERPLEVYEGGYRVVSPEETWQRYQHLISPLSGPICYLHTMPGRHREDRPVFAAGYLVTPQKMVADFRFDRLCSGKGRTISQARASALCETLERYSGVYQGDEYRQSGCMQDFKGTAIDFNKLQNFSELQFSQRGVINNLSDDRRRQVPEPFSKRTLIDWTPAWHLLSQSMRWVPLNYCYADAPDSSGGDYGIHNPNGVAAGNCREEAIIQGFLELVERDAVAIWWYNQLRRPAVPAAYQAAAFVQQSQQQYQIQGWNLWLLDLTTDLQIPVCAALAQNPDTGRFAIGFGCHFDWPLAIERALTELNQLHDLTGKAPNPWDHDALTSADFLFVHEHVDAAVYNPIQGGSLKEVILRMAQRIDSAGMELLVVDKTRPDIGLPVMQVIVPGLRHFWPRLGEGRLYDVPVQMGWLARPRTETELNAVPLFL
ncbi:MAG: TOMM precursor leader peptide-binding protein [Marinobacterium sp.]|nr:TOMM precursor leader peptide-binding protein [Marinobacterium sp.]